MSKYSTCSLSVKTALFFGAVLIGAFLHSPSIVEAATLSVSPGTGVYTAGNTFTVRVQVNTAGEPINAAEGTLSFNPSKLQVAGISKGTIFNLWTVEPTFSNANGSVTFGGGSPSGYTGSAGTVLSITFRALSAGSAKLQFTSGSVLAADGRGTNVLTSMGSGSYTIASAEVVPEPETIEYIAPPNTPGEPHITSQTHPDPSGWYTEKTAHLTWTVPSGVTAVRTLLDENSGSIPTKVYEPAISEIRIDDVDEGVSYFHLQFRNADGWGRVAHYRLAVDTTAPSVFTLSLTPDADLSSPEQQLAVVVEDTPSGISHYLVQIDGGEPFRYVDDTGSSTIPLPPLEPGHHSVVIEAFDYAGNSRVASLSFAILAFDKPQFTDFPSEINEEVIPVIKGITRPHAKVIVTFHKIGAGPSEVTYEVTSDETGVFVFIPEGTLTTGVYELQAVAIDQYGAQSEPSDAIRIAVQQPGYLRLGMFVVNVLSIIASLIGILVLSILGFLLFLRKVRTMRKSVVTETKEALSVLDAEFGLLEKTLKEQQKALATSRRTKKLTKSEQQLINEMEEALSTSRRRISKEVSDVDDSVV